MAKKIIAKFDVISTAKFFQVINKVDNKSLPRFELDPSPKELANFLKQGLFFELDHSPKEHANFLKKNKPCLGNFVWSDFTPDKNYEETGDGNWEDTEMTVINSTAELKYIKTKKKMYAILLSGKVEIEFENKAQSERFLDKDWSQEWIIPSLTFEPLKSGDKAHGSIFQDMDRGLYTLE